MRALIVYAHILALVVWLGGMIFFSFIAAPSIFSALGRDAAGTVVGAIFPKYFMVGYASSLALLGTLWAMWRTNLGAVRGPLLILAACAALSIVSGAVVGAKARDVKTRMYAAAAGPEKEKLRADFHKIHLVSTVLNLVVLLLLAVYVRYLPLVVGPPVIP
ncbi:MAG: DUF4149 domain-containing protein [Nitrospinae bacterium]|nr:DUF4149 domain-containing protein [Nitrospinota bacterium]